MKRLAPGKSLLMHRSLFTLQHDGVLREDQSIHQRLPKMMLTPQDKPLVKFVVLTQARTGSNMLVSMLDGHPETRCIGEVFNPHSAFG